MAEAIEPLIHVLRRIETLNLLAIGIAIIVAWLLLSGLKKGLRKKGRDKGSAN